MGCLDIPLGQPRAPSRPRLPSTGVQALALSPYTYRLKYRAHFTLSLFSCQRRRRQITFRQDHTETRSITFHRTRSATTTVTQAPAAAKYTVSRLLPGPSAGHRTLVVGQM